jgi:DNA-binding transcriptional LysR family regulator
MNWDDLRAFLAVAQLGSLRQAAHALGVTQPTIARRLKMLEADLGVPLFERQREGHRLTAAGTVLLPQARAVETAALRVEQSSLGLLGRLAETVRVAAGEWAASVLVRGLARIADGPRIELVVSSGQPAPAAGRTPEVLVRHGLPHDGGGLTRRVGALGCAVYGARAFAEARALPLSAADLAALPWLGFVEEQEHYVTMRWLRERMRGRPPAARLMNTDLMLVAAKDGIGAALLPCFLGDAAPGLARLSAPIEELRADYWAIVHPDLSRNPSVRTVAAWITECFRATESAADGLG